MQFQRNHIEIHRQDLLILAALFLLALLSRLYGISYWPITGDETATVLYAGERQASLVNPAYYNLVVASFYLFGVSEWSARLPAALIGGLSIPIFFFTWRNIFGRHITLIASLFLIFSAWHLYHSQFSRFYSGVFLFGSLSYYCYVQAVRSNSLGYLIGALATNAVGTLFHVTSVMVSAACGLFSLLLLLPPLKLTYSRRIALVHLAICLTIGLAAMPFLWEVWSTRTTVESQSWGHGPFGTLLQVVRNIEPAIAICGLFGTITLIRDDRDNAFFLFIGIGFPIIMLLISSIFVNVHSPYVIYILPLMAIAAAVLCDKFRQRLASYPIASHALTVIILVSILPPFISYYSAKSSLDIRDAVTFIRDAYQPGDHIVSYVYEFDYYLDHDYPIERLGHDQIKNDKQIEVLNSYKNSNQRVWLVLQAWREPLDKTFEAWLLKNASLVWRQYETRFDYLVHGYQIFLVDGARNN